MKVYRNKNDGLLYTISLVSPRMVLGSWFEAHSLWGGKIKKYAELKDYILISER